MTQEQRLECLIHLLLNKNPEYRNLIIPEQEYEKKKLLRSLMNIRMPDLKRVFRRTGYIFTRRIT